PPTATSRGGRARAAGPTWPRRSPPPPPRSPAASPTRGRYYEASERSRPVTEGDATLEASAWAPGRRPGQRSEASINDRPGARPAERASGATMKFAGKALIWLQNDVDTDQIIPARFLKTTARTALGVHLFADRPDAPRP